jgi:RNA polymerase subunit RPABC4/transcription elongation factor Spt4
MSREETGIGAYMFCLQCGNEVKDGAKFCAKCGCAVPAAGVPTATVQAASVEKRCASCGTVLKDGVKFCPKCGGAISADVSPVPPPPSAIQQQMEEKRMMSKLLLIAIIVAPLLLVGFYITGTILSNIREKEYLLTAEQYWKELTDEQRENKRHTIINPDYFKKQNKEQRGQDMSTFGVLLLILAIPTLLTVIGKKKNKRKMILAAGIVYIVTGVGIPSAVLCFIANAKMKKQEVQ